jgi:monovalent cation/hydrogen antiporter
MPQTIQVMVLLLGVVAAVAVIATRLKIPAAILLVLTGVVLALAPGLPRIELSPEFVLLIVLPPLIYSSAVRMSWREFRSNLRPISLLAVGCVLFTSLAVAAATHWILGFSWPLGFLAGAIVSPPDALAPLSIARRLHLPKRLAVILEGEGLANDATALVLYRFAVAAVSIGSFSFTHAFGTFAAILVSEIAWGLGVGWVMLRVRRWVNEPSIEILLSILTPFIAYWPPEQLGGSGVLATVATGLYFSWNGPRLISAATRLQGVFFWDFLVYLIEGMVFLVTGLQAHRLINAITGYPTSELVLSAAAVCAVVIGARFVWMFPASYFPRLLVATVRHQGLSTPWQEPFLLAFTGIRGIVSLAAALAIPVATANGEPFPHRDLILFLAFCVILTTLVGQGLLLPTVVRWLRFPAEGLKEAIVASADEVNARRRGIAAVADRLEQLMAERQLASTVVSPFQSHIRERLRQLDLIGTGSESTAALQLNDEIELALIQAERETINGLSRRGEVEDQPRRRIERDLDLREARLADLRPPIPEPLSLASADRSVMSPVGGPDGAAN